MVTTPGSAAPWWAFWRKRDDRPPVHAPDCVDGSKCGQVEHCPPPWPDHNYRPMAVMENYWAECSCGWAASDCHPAEFRAERDWKQHIADGGRVDQRIVGWKHGYPVVEATDGTD